MSELYEQIVERRNAFERFVARMPGFAARLDKQALRAADQMLRDHVAAEVKNRIVRFNLLEKKLLDSSGITLMNKTSRVKSRLQLFHDRVKMAPPGYSGPFVPAKIHAEEWEKLYNFDEAQIRFVEQFDIALNRLAETINDQQQIEEAIATLDQLAVEANESWSGRETVLTHLGKSV